MIRRESRTLLLVDSSATILLYFSMLLRRLEYKVLVARSAEDALRILGQTTPFLIVTELVLPRMSGLDFVKQLKESDQFKSIPIIVLTSETDRQVQEACRRAGCAAVLTKPVEPDVLYRALQAASESVPRSNIRLSTSLKTVIGDGSLLGGSSRTEYATAISEEGLYVRTRYPQPRNALTPLSIFLPEREIKVRAVVLYRYDAGEGPFGEPGMGMKFVDISRDDRLLIRAFIKEQLTKDIGS